MGIPIGDANMFVSAAMEMVAQSPGSRVMVLVDSDDGLKMLQNSGSLFWQRGLLATALDICEKTIDSRMFRSMENEKALDEFVERAVSQTKGKPQ